MVSFNRVTILLLSRTSSSAFCCRSTFALQCVILRASQLSDVPGDYPARFGRKWRLTLTLPKISQAIDFHYKRPDSAHGSYQESVGLSSNAGCIFGGKF